MGCEESVQTMLDSQDYDNVYALFAKTSYTLLSVVESGKDLEKVYNLLIAIVSQAKQEDLLDLIPGIVEPVVIDSNPAFALHKLKILSNLYNSLDSSSHLRYSVFLAIVQLASESDELESIVPVLPNLNSYFVAWGVEQDEERRMILLLSEVFGGKNEFQTESYEYLVQYLKTFPSKPFPKQVLETAAKAVKIALSLPTVTNFSDLFALGPVEALKATHKTLLSLVQIFVSGDVKDFQEFDDEHQGFLVDNGFDKDALLTKIRLLSLATLACEHVGVVEGLPFAKIHDALVIDTSDVEEWIVMGIRSGLVDARIDQVNSVVWVSRATHRVFGKEQWDLLGQRLDSWSANLKDMLTVLQNAKYTLFGGQQQAS
ncbi:hypothetical protein HDU83_007069 [Entophlyctis luteolus]|nr:hypothetical protein HDU83_007069 [Entophlyctis luteolus]